MNRKKFLKTSSKLGMLMGIAPMAACAPGSTEENKTDASLGKSAKGNMFGFKAEPIDKVRVGFIGLGNRGSTLLKMYRLLVKQGHAEIVALCDLRESQTTKNLEYCKENMGSTPETYHSSPEIWKDVAKRDDIDLLVIATPWRFHTPMAIFGMENGKHVASEVPIGYTVDDCWKIIETAEKTQKHCIMIENCCYNGEELWVLNMVNEGVFGDITQCEGAYIHDLRKHLLTEGYYEGYWRLKQHQERDGNFYTTHGLGPISQYMDIGRGDTYDYLISMSTREKNLSDAAKELGSEFSGFKCGDMNNTLIKTKKGKVIMLQFDVHTGRPYNRLNNVIGTKAVHEGYPSRLYIDHEELSYGGHKWLDEAKYKEYREKYDHPMWTKLQEMLKQNKEGHGGMDFVMMYRLIRCLNKGLPLDINLYDSVMWSAVTPLSEMSVAEGGAPIKFPDFTGGTWKNENKSEMMRDI